MKKVTEQQAQTVRLRRMHRIHTDIVEVLVPEWRPPEPQEHAPANVRECELLFHVLLRQGYSGDNRFGNLGLRDDVGFYLGSTSG